MQFFVLQDCHQLSKVIGVFFFVLSEDQYVIEVNRNKVQVSQKWVPQRLECQGSFLEATGSHEVIKMTHWGNKCGLGNIRWVDCDLLVCRPKIEYRKDLRILSLVKLSIRTSLCGKGKCSERFACLELCNQRKTVSFHPSWGQKAQEQPMEMFSGEFDLGRKFVHNFLNLMGFKLEESVRGSKEGLCPR